MVCYHDEADGCECRKPTPGMLLAAADELGLDLARSFMVGDRWRDIDAGRSSWVPDRLRRPRVCRAPTGGSGCRRRRPSRSGGLDPHRGRSGRGVPCLTPARSESRSSPTAPTSRECSLSPRTAHFGFTTNPTLMRRSGVTDYATFAKEVLAAVTDHPISFEVVADEFDEMRRQARLIASWGANVFVKIPVTNTRGESSAAPDPGAQPRGAQAQRHSAPLVATGLDGRPSVDRVATAPSYPSSRVVLRTRVATPYH